MQKKVIYNSVLLKAHPVIRQLCAWTCDPVYVISHLTILLEKSDSCTWKPGFTVTCQ